MASIHHLSDDDMSLESDVAKMVDGQLEAYDRFACCDNYDVSDDQGNYTPKGHVTWPTPNMMAT